MHLFPPTLTKSNSKHTFNFLFFHTHAQFLSLPFCLTFIPLFFFLIIMLAYFLSGNNTLSVWWVTLSVEHREGRGLWVDGMYFIKCTHQKKSMTQKKKYSFQVFFLYFHLNDGPLALLAGHKQKITIQTLGETTRTWK